MPASLFVRDPEGKEIPVAIDTAALDDLAADQSAPRPNPAATPAATVAATDPAITAELARLRSDLDAANRAREAEAAKAAEHASMIESLRAEAAARKAEAVASAERELKVNAAAFAREAVRLGHATKAEESALAQDYLDAAADDAASPKQFAFVRDGKEMTGSRVDKLAARVKARPAHAMFEERAMGHPALAGAALLSNSGEGDGPEKPKTRREVLEAAAARGSKSALAALAALPSGRN